MSKWDHKKKQRLKKFDFSGAGASVALVSIEQGGPANGISTLITKATKGITDEQITKAQASLSGEQSTDFENVTLSDKSPENKVYSQGELMNIQEVVKSAELQDYISEAINKAVQTKDAEIASQNEIIKSLQSAETARKKEALIIKAKGIGIASEQVEAKADAWYSAIEAGFGSLVDAEIAAVIKAKEAVESSDLFKDKDTRVISDEEKQRNETMRAAILKAQGMKNPTKV